MLIIIFLGLAKKLKHVFECSPLRRCYTMQRFHATATNLKRDFEVGWSCVKLSLSNLLQLHEKLPSVTAP